ncbi:cilia- and flagella-associated protein 100 family [Trichomonas vaginalis G3]|nr:cilia- and flagella-associated protein 100 family [Trichomonas vaginalis G3]KAI5525467.1 cilia- and flagella-associated protein 100 family [Trichomonas vaginalis G3]
MENEEKKWEDKDKEIDNLGVKYKCISVQADNLYVDQKNAFEQARSNAIQLQATKMKKKRDIIDLQEEYKKDLLTLQEYQGYQSFLQQFVPKGKKMFDHFNDVKQIEAELANEQKENLFLITNCIELESQINNCQNDYEQSLKNIEKLILNIKPIIEETYDTSDEALMKVQYKNEFNNKSKEIEKITDKIRKIYDQFFEHDDHMKASTMLNKINAGLEDFYNRSALLDQKYMNQQQKEINKIRREQQRADQMMQKELVAQVKKEQALERANKPIVRRTGRPLVARSFIPKVIKNNDEELRLKALAERRQTEMLFGKFE